MLAEDGEGPLNNGMVVALAVGGGGGAIALLLLCCVVRRCRTAARAKRQTNTYAKQRPTATHLVTRHI